MKIQKEKKSIKHQGNANRKSQTQFPFYRTNDLVSSTHTHTHTHTQLYTGRHFLSFHKTNSKIKVCPKKKSLHCDHSFILRILQAISQMSNLFIISTSKIQHVKYSQTCKATLRNSYKTRFPNILFILTVYPFSIQQTLLIRISSLI